MKTRCISSRLSDNQVKKIWATKPHFQDVRDFGTIVGKEYLVFGISIMDGEPWIDILSESKYLVQAPLCLFEIINRRISKYWVVGFSPHGDFIMRPPSILDQPYYFDDLSEYKPDVLNEFQKIKDLLENEWSSS
jgi:hypothetical protein